VSSGDQDLFFVLADKALRSKHGMASYWALQRRHEDGSRWVDLAHFASRSDANEGRATIHDRAPDIELRVFNVHRPV
jgi:hypothetical protein